MFQAVVIISCALILLFAERVEAQMMMYPSYQNQNAMYPNSYYPSMNSNSYYSSVYPYQTYNTGSAAAYQAPSYQTYQSNSYSSGTCASISHDMQLGSRDAQVSALQQFLVGRNYPGSGNWMMTGMFGRATEAAVRSFQSEMGLPVTGVVDWQTRSAIQNICGGYNNSGGYNNAYNTNYNGYNNSYADAYSGAYGNNSYGGGYNNASYNTGQYSYNNQYYQSYGGQPRLDSPSDWYAAGGASLSVYGRGFDNSSNKIYIGNSVLDVGSNGTVLTFTVPYLQPGTYPMYVTNRWGTSNSMNINITNYGHGYPNYYGYVGYSGYSGYQNSSGCGYGANYWNCYTPSYPYNNRILNLNNISPAGGRVGSEITLYGSGFTLSDNTLHFGRGIIAGLRSNDGLSLSFSVPMQLSGYGSQTTYPGPYQLFITTPDGRNSNEVTFAVLN